MTTKTDIQLRNFFIFNSLYGPKEGEELKKILYYYPITDNVDLQVNNVGLVEGIIQFTGTFRTSHDLNCLHTQKTRQLYFQPEKNFWFAMTLNVPTLSKSKENSSEIEYLEEEIQDHVYKAVLKEAYLTYRLLNGTMEETVKQCNVGILKTKLEHFFKQYIKNQKLNHCDILNVFNGIQYLPLDTHTFLKVQCFINDLECRYSDVKYSAFLYSDHLVCSMLVTSGEVFQNVREEFKNISVWIGMDHIFNNFYDNQSGINPLDMQVIYQYLINTLLPANLETELRGGSMPRHSSSPFAALHLGRFITGPTNLKTAKTVGNVPKVHLFHEDVPDSYYLVVYRALSASVCLFIKEDAKLTLELFKELDELISPKLIAIVTDIAEYCQKQVVTPSNIPENSPRFIYFNKLNLAYKSTVHLDNKQTGNLACGKDLVKVMADLNGKKEFLGHAGETVVKTMNDYWVVAKTSNSRECYIALQQKNANLIDISDEIKKVCDTELKGIFFHHM